MGSFCILIVAIVILTKNLLKSYPCRFLSSRRADCKIYIGKETGVLNARKIQKLSVLTIRIVHYKHLLARAMEDLWIAA